MGNVEGKGRVGMEARERQSQERLGDVRADRKKVRRRSKPGRKGDNESEGQGWRRDWGRLAEVLEKGYPFLS